MPLFLNDEQTMLAETAQPFIADIAPVSQLRQLRDDRDETGFSRETWRRFAEMGFAGIFVPERFNGLGLGHVEGGIIAEELGRNLTLSPFISTAIGAALALGRGDEALAQTWLPRLAAGDLIASLAFDEAASHRPSHVALKAERAGNGGFRLSGAKTFVAHGHVADLHIVSARTAGSPDEPDGITLFAVDAKTRGLSTSVERLADGGLAARLMFDDVELGAQAVIGEVDGGAPLVEAVLDGVRTGTSAELIGVGGGAMDMTVGYLKERRQFGALIGSFQALQHRAAHLYSELEVARAAVMKAQQLLDEGSPRARAAAHVAKAFAGDATRLAVQEGVQLHGGIGMTDEYDIGLYMKRQRVIAESFGDSDYHADRLAILSGY